MPGITKKNRPQRQMPQGSAPQPQPTTSTSSTPIQAEPQAKTSKDSTEPTVDDRKPLAKKKRAKGKAAARLDNSTREQCVFTVSLPKSPDSPVKAVTTEPPVPNQAPTPEIPTVSDAGRPTSRKSQRKNRPAVPAPQPFLVKLPPRTFSLDLASKTGDATVHAKKPGTVDASASTSRVSSLISNKPCTSLSPASISHNSAVSHDASEDTSVPTVQSHWTDENHGEPSDSTTAYTSTESSYSSDEVPSSSSSNPKEAAAPSPLIEYRPYCRDGARGNCKGLNCRYFHPGLQYDRPVQGVKRPQFSKECPRWARGKCTLSYACKYAHGDLEYDEPVHAGATGPSLSADGAPSLDVDLKEAVSMEYRYYCRDNVRGSCTLGVNCRYFHADLQYDHPVQGIKRPRYRSMCFAWQRGACELGYACQYIHNDLEYDDPKCNSKMYGQHTNKSLGDTVPPVANGSSTPRNCPSPSTSLADDGGRTEDSYTPSVTSSEFSRTTISSIKKSNHSTNSSLGVTFPAPREVHNIHTRSATMPDVRLMDRKRTAPPRPPPPDTQYICRGWLINRCNLGSSCSFVHPNTDNDRPVLLKYPLPTYQTPCRDPKCSLGYACEYTHDLDYHSTPPHRIKKYGEAPPPAPRQIPYQIRDLRLETFTPTPKEINHGDPPVGWRPRPNHNNVCLLSVRGECTRRYKCPYIHNDLEYDLPRPVPPPAEVPISVCNDPPVGMRPYPQNAEICHNWLRNRCEARYACKFRHGDLEYDAPLRPPGLPVPPNKAATWPSQPNIQTSGTRGSWTLKVQDHARIRIGPGFDVQEVVTGFETPWLYLSRIPNDVTSDDVARLLRRFGDVQDIRMPSNSGKTPTMLVRARFSVPAEAREACTLLNGSEAFNSTITAHLPMSSGAPNNKTMFTDTTVRIRWEAPSKIAYCGYSTMEEAQKAMDAARFPFKDHYMHASIHTDLPVAGVVTVRFRGVPLDANVGDMERFNHPDDVIWSQPNYQNLSQSTNGIKRMLYTEKSEVPELNILPPPYKNAGTVTAYAYYSTVLDAKAARNRINGRKPVFTGKTTVFADHVQSLTFSLAPALYNILGPDIHALCRTVKRCRRRTTMAVFSNPGPKPSSVRLSGDDTKELGQLKAEFEKILNWEVVKVDSRVAWDPFFAFQFGAQFLEQAERANPGVIIETNVPRRTIRLRGWSAGRQRVREHIVAKIRELQSQKMRMIGLEGPLMGLIMGKHLIQLQDDIGRHNVMLDLVNRQLRVRGPDAVFDAACEAVQRVRQSYQEGLREQRNIASCPVCFDQVTKPVTLDCGHRWCRGCISSYLTASVENKCFPLSCLGNEGKCKEHIPLVTARKILSVPDFDALVDAAFTSFVQARPDEFHYCPTPDCTQIYRSPATRRDDTVLQCPSCLLRICPNCHVEAHDGFECPDPDGGNGLFKEWMRNNDVKACPGCKVLIERAEGCNHVTCTQCKTHICWVCMQTFPGGVGVYDHMRGVHGGIGLGP